MKYYIELKDSLNLTYSLDMIRLNFSLGCTNEVFDNFINRYNSNYGFNINMYMSRGVGYHYLYTINVEDINEGKCSFALGVGLNCLTEHQKSGFIEFNPNKCFQLSLFNEFLNDFYKLLRSCKLVRYDLAIDVPVSRNKIKMVRDFRCNYKYLVSFGNDATSDLNRSKTEYQGRRSHNKFTKLYDKTKESHLDFVLSRIEFTFVRDELKFKNLPKFYVYDSLLCKDLDFSILNSSELVLIDLLRNSEDINYYLGNLRVSSTKEN